MFIKKISDVFDQSRGEISGNLGLTRFDNITGNHTILFNTLSPEFNGTQLVPVGSNGLLYSATDVDLIVSDEPENNTNIALLIQPNNKRTWEAYSGNDTIRIVIKLKEISQVNGLSITFDDAAIKSYQIKEGVFLNNENEIISKIDHVVFTNDGNNRQFVQLLSKLDDIDRIVLDIEVANVDDHVWRMSNITVYSYMDKDALQTLSQERVITWIPVTNGVLLRKGPTDTFMLSTNTNDEAPKKLNPESLPSLYSDRFGSALPLRPILDLQHLDEVDKNTMIKISNKAPTAITNFEGGVGQIYSFVPDMNTNNITLSLSPTEQLNRFSDEAVTQFPQLIEKGYIKKGGYKNYVLTFYIRLSNIIANKQHLVWKYGGWMFNKEYPELARSTNIYIPIGTPSNIKVASEYIYDNIKEIVTQEGEDTVIQSVIDQFAIEEDMWIGLQFTRQVVSPTRSIQRVRVNVNPFNDEDGGFRSNNFKDLFLFIDNTTENHRANTWGGINEIISINGARNVDIYGLSIYEIDPQS